MIRLAESAGLISQIARVRGIVLHQVADTLRTHAEFTAGLLDRMTADAAAIDRWERATPRLHQ
jgi:hypothetical protein